MSEENKLGGGLENYGQQIPNVDIQVQKNELFENELVENNLIENKTGVIIGLEIHAYLATKSKLFCACSTESAVVPNSQTCIMCLGMPGAKPVLNEKAVELGVRVGFALNCQINSEFFFSRKTYFYPDMASNYQITQFEVPVAQSGFVILPSGKKVRIRRAHLGKESVTAGC